MATPNLSPGTSNNTSTFSSTGADGVKTVLLLSATTVTVTGAACSSAPAFNLSQVFVFPSVVSHHIIPRPSSGAKIQGPSPAPQSSPSITNLNLPPAAFTFAPGA